MMTYNKIRHLELVKPFLDFKKQAKNLYRENQDEYFELLDYHCMLEDYAFWKNRKQFVLFMKNFVHDSIDIEQFQFAFSELYQKTSEAHDAFKIDLKGLKNFQLDPRSNGFARFIIFVYRQFEVLEDEYFSEQDVKDIVRDVIQEIQPYL